MNKPIINIKPTNITEIFINQKKINILEYKFDNEILLKQTLVPEYDFILKDNIDCNAFVVEYINKVSVYVFEDVIIGYNIVVSSSFVDIKKIIKAQRYEDFSGLPTTERYVNPSEDFSYMLLNLDNDNIFESRIDLTIFEEVSKIEINNVFIMFFNRDITKRKKGNRKKIWDNFLREQSEINIREFKKSLQILNLYNFKEGKFRELDENYITAALKRFREKLKDKIIQRQEDLLEILFYLYPLSIQYCDNDFSDLIELNFQLHTNIFLKKIKNFTKLQELS